MSYRSRAALQQDAHISSFPPRVARAYAERPFGLHPTLFVGTIAAYAMFLAILGATFMVPALAIPFVIFAVYVVMAFGVPAMWGRMVPRQQGRPQSWQQFRSEGMIIETGPIDSGSAMAQILVLPWLLVAFAAAIAIITAVG